MRLSDGVVTIGAGVIDISSVIITGAGAGVSLLMSMLDTSSTATAVTGGGVSDAVSAADSVIIATSSVF